MLTLNPKKTTSYLAPPPIIYVAKFSEIKKIEGFPLFGVAKRKKVI